MGRWGQALGVAQPPARARPWRPGRQPGPMCSIAGPPAAALSGQGRLAAAPGAPTGRWLSARWHLGAMRASPSRAVQPQLVSSARARPARPPRTPARRLHRAAAGRPRLMPLLAAPRSCYPQLELEQVAGAYANALVEVAKKTSSLEAVHADVDALAGVMKENSVRRRWPACRPWRQGTAAAAADAAASESGAARSCTCSRPGAGPRRLPTPQHAPHACLPARAALLHPPDRPARVGCCPLRRT